MSVEKGAGCPRFPSYPKFPRNFHFSNPQTVDKFLYLIIKTFSNPERFFCETAWEIFLKIQFFIEANF